MSVLDGVNKQDLRDLLGKGWLTHDGMWFFHTYREVGIENANALNRAAIQSMAPIEINRVKKILGFGDTKIETFEALEGFMAAAFEIILPGSVLEKFRFTTASKYLVHWEWERGECFAFKGMSQIGVIDSYHCGVIFRIECWLEALGVEYLIQPKINGCIMHETGACSGDIRVFLTG